MKYAFSYVVFGSDEKYLTPLLVNIRIINENFKSNAVIYIYVANVPESWIIKLNTFENTILRLCPGLEGSPNTLKMLLRYRVCEEVDDDEVRFLFRDADSLITTKEIEIIKHWGNHTDFAFCVIRDHLDHVMPIMGGLFGCTKHGRLIVGSLLKTAFNNASYFNNYGNDQKFLDRVIYSKYRKNFLVYSSTVVFPGDIVIDITSTDQNIGGYCGQECSSRKKYTLLPTSIYRFLDYRGSRVRVPGWVGIQLLGKL